MSNSELISLGIVCNNSAWYTHTDTHTDREVCCEMMAADIQIKARGRLGKFGDESSLRADGGRERNQTVTDNALPSSLP